MKKSVQQESKGLKTFFVFAGIVIFFILISLSVKLFFMIRDSKFDGRHQFAFTIAQKEEVKKIVILNPSKYETVTLNLTGDLVSPEYAGRLLGFIPDAQIDTNENFDLNQDTRGLLRTIGLKYTSVETDLTILDVVKLIIAAYKNSNDETEQLDVKGNEYDIGLVKDLFVDEEITKDDVSIQIVNASGISGMGGRLENVLVNLGCNVISVTTAQKTVAKSQMQYFGEKTYTLEKIERLLGFAALVTERQQIADIVIVVGEDNKNSSKF